MTTLILMRHAKSSWSDKSLSDHDRPLNDRGRRSAPLMAKWLTEHGYRPECVLCSSARRTVETTRLMAESGLVLPEYNPIRELYLAPASLILETIADRMPAEANTVLVVGHNPGLEELTSMLAGRMIPMPTAAVAIFRFDTGQDPRISVGARTELIHFVIPRSLDETLTGD